MIRLYRNPSLLSTLYPSLVWKLKSKDTIFLTFDDGPDPMVTPWVLDQLRQYNSKASFFCLGSKINAHPDLVKQVVSEGHLVANHTFSHLKGTNTEDSVYINDIADCDEELRKLGVVSRFFRPPYGKIKRSQIAKLRDKKIIMWNRLSWDFDPSLNPEKSIRIMKYSTPGSILVFHDSRSAFDNLKIILPELLNYFNEKGLKMTSLDD